MASKRCLSGELEEEATHDHFSPPKRQRTTDQDLDFKRRQYTVAWICALPIEMAAARAVLDATESDEEQLPNSPDDTNTYVLGRISQHKVVLACLPSVYGTNNAAIVATNLKRTFPCIRAALMVGVGGGAPNMADLRLGDVVVGTRVMQYDAGKIVGNGEIERTSIVRLPSQTLDTAVSTLRSRHMLEPSRVGGFFKETESYPALRRPDSPDRLFTTDYWHPTQRDDCRACDKTMLVPRSRRSSDDPKIHYGVIASSNQLMKSGVVRDLVSTELGALCFEMEAAGVMDALQCLAIRGICDYADSHKNKIWQGYAAAVAAAYAKELLGVLPPVSPEASLSTPTDMELARQEILASQSDIDSIFRQETLMKALEFDRMDERQTTISAALSKTCRWFLESTQYNDWLDPATQQANHGFLWMRGKAGAGKSTIMKFLYRETKSQARHAPDSLVASFFFNARGDVLQRSVSGMYRSLLLQLLQRFGDLQSLLKDPDLVPPRLNDCPALESLKELFRTAVLSLDSKRAFTCFIDALDECDEQQARQMVHFFEDLGEESSEKGVCFRVCFSSRPYPYINIDKGIMLTLEEQPGHAEDVAKYVNSRLKIRGKTLAADLTATILEKASGVFLWVVLVVDILNKEAGYALRKTLAEIPAGLSDLFKELLRRDEVNMPYLQFCILWILCANRPLSPQEFCHAVWIGLMSQDTTEHLVDHELPDVTDSDAMVQRVISQSKGLAEITKTEHPTVQFIHESVRDFLVKDKGLHIIWPRLSFEWESHCHDMLRHCCHAYLTSFIRAVSIEATKDTTEEQVLKTHPLLWYACYQVLQHAEIAAITKPKQQKAFLKNFSVRDWVRTFNIFTISPEPRYTDEVSLVYLVAELGHTRLLRLILDEDPNIDFFGERHGHPILAAARFLRWDTLSVLLESTTTLFQRDSADTPTSSTRSTLGSEIPLVTLMITNDQLEILEAMLKHGIDLNEDPGGGYNKPLIHAAGLGQLAGAQFLILHGADVNVSDKYGCTALHEAARNGHIDVAEQLIAAGADVNQPDAFGDAALSKAAGTAQEEVCQLLIKHGSRVDQADMRGRTALSYAVRTYSASICLTLLGQGADANARDNGGRTPIFFCARVQILNDLLANGADVHAVDDRGQTALHYHPQWDSRLHAENRHVVRALIRAGLCTDAKSSDGKTPLHFASEAANLDALTVLLEEGADVLITDNQGHTALQNVRPGARECADLLVKYGAV